MTYDIRPARDADGAALIGLIGGCWREYPGCDVPVEEDIPEISTLASDYARQGGALWVAEADGGIIGMIGVKPHGDAWEVSKMYAAAAARGGGLAQALLALAEGFARGHGGERAMLWSDTRFQRAHRFYEKQGYVRQGGIRALDDLAKSLEFHYAKPLARLAVMRLDAAGAGSAARGLAAILAGCVEGGADLGFRAPLAMEKALAASQSLARDVAEGRARLIAGWVEGRLAGCAALRRDGRETGPHVAELSRLMVAPAARRRGLARLLVAEAEAAAREDGRRVMFLWATDDAGLTEFYRELGYHPAGRIPQGGGLPDGGIADALIFYKPIGDEP